jgi:hypothetical protein
MLQAELAVKHRYLVELNLALIRSVCGRLGIETRIVLSSELGCPGKKVDRLIAICRRLSADVYLSGPAARSYIRPERFAEAGIGLVYKDYSGYPDYPQRHPPFEHGVSVLDLLFHTGADAPWFIWGWREDLEGAGTGSERPEREGAG